MVCAVTQRQPHRIRRQPWPGRCKAIAAAAVALISVAACGGGDSDEGRGLSAGDADASDDVRTVEVAMVDNEFDRPRIEVGAGETVRFVFTNEGAVTHDAVIGDEVAQAEHEEEMRAAEGGAMEGMDHGSEAGGDEGAIRVEPGETGELTHTFSSGDPLLIGCHEPGHYDAGMRIDLAVTEA
jgi:uncharacterized cupredoxin-like copper-binding protein